MPYVHYTEQEKEQARRTNIPDLIRSTGGTLKRSGTEYKWLDGTQKVTIRGHLWYHQYEQKGGDAIDFVRKFMGKSYPEAKEYLLGGYGVGKLSSSPPIERKQQEPIEMPPKNNGMRRVYAYLLNSRGLEKSVVDSFVRKGMIYESADYHNAVFVGYDTDGNPRHASLRSTAGASNFRGNAPNSTSADALSKALGSRTVMSGSVSRGKNDPTQSLQMIERPLMTPDELKSMSKGQFVVMKTGAHPMKVKLKLFFHWGIKFDDSNPYSVTEHANRKVKYAERMEIVDAVVAKYHPEYLEDMPSESTPGGSFSTPTRAESLSHEPHTVMPKKVTDKRKGNSSPARVPSTTKRSVPLEMEENTPHD